VAPARRTDLPQSPDPPRSSRSGRVDRDRQVAQEPGLIQSELDRRLEAARYTDPTKRREEALRRDLARLQKSIERLLTAYQEDLLSLDELRHRMPELRRREYATRAELQSIAVQTTDRAAYLRLAETLTAVLIRLRSSAETLDIIERQRVARLLVKEILVGDDRIVIRHSIPLPTGPSGGHDSSPNGGYSGPAPDKSYLLRSASKRAALRGPLIHRADQAAFHHPRLEERPDEFEHTFIGHPRGDARHQTVMIDPVEKFFEIKINYDVVARGNVSLRLGYRLMGGASRSEAVAVPGKRRIPPLLENLQQGLLDQSVDDARYAELSEPAVRLGYFDPFDRLRLVGSREQLRPDAWPVLTQVVLSVVDGHPIHARTALIPSNAFPRSDKILSVAHLLYQLFRHCRAFGCWLRHEWFGPLVTADRGFTPTTRFELWPEVGDGVTG
jgi:site-specific DNA recombinase